MTKWGKEIPIGTPTVAAIFPRACGLCEATTADYDKYRFASPRALQFEDNGCLDHQGRFDFRAMNLAVADIALG